MKLALVVVVLLSTPVAAQSRLERIDSTGPDPMLRQYVQEIAGLFRDRALAQSILDVNLERTDLRACLTFNGRTECGYDFGPFGHAVHPERNEPYEMRTYRPAAATEPTIRYPRIAGFVAADFVIRRLVPVVLRAAGFEDDAAHLQSLQSARTEAEMRALADESKRVFERLRDLATPSERHARRQLVRARVAARVAWQATLPLRRVTAAPTTAVFDKIVEAYAAAALADAESASAAAVEMLLRVAAVARSIRPYQDPA